MIMKRYCEKVKNPVLKVFSWIQYKKLLKYEPYIYSNFDLCIMISEKDLVYLKTKNSEVNAINIPAGVDENLLKVKKKTIIPHSIAHIGHTNWYPNYDSLNWFLSEIFPIILRRFSDATLYVYGGGNTKNFPVPENVRNNVKIIGFVDDLWDSLSEIEITIVPIRIGGGIRIKILELLASGNLIVSTSIGIEGINVKDEEHILVGDKVDDFAYQILRVFNGYESSKLISNGRNFISRKYTWKIIVKDFEKSYEKLMMYRKS
jgi:glycosyltransferase involved in cell wall biosynthesis